MDRRTFFGLIAAGLGVAVLPTDIFIESEDGQKVQFRRDGREIFFVDANRVNLEDMIHVRPGSIIRCRGNPADCIRVFTLGG